MDDDDYGGSRPLSNADFRRMLESSRHGAGRNQEGGEKKKRPKPVKPHKPKPAGEGGAEEPGYRQGRDVCPCLAPLLCTQTGCAACAPSFA